MWGDPGYAPSGLGPLVRGIVWYISGLVGGPMVIATIAMAFWLALTFALCWMLLTDAWKDFRDQWPNR